jgi:hypothetical protein
MPRRVEGWWRVVEVEGYKIPTRPPLKKLTLKRGEFFLQGLS